MYRSIACSFGVMVFLATVNTAAAEDTEIKCNHNGGTAELSACAEVEYKMADKELNEVYKKLIAAAKKSDATDGDPKGLNNYWGGYEAPIREAQKAWIAFRDKECTIRTLDVIGGSLRQVEYPDCLRDITEERTRELERIYQDIQ